MEMVNCMLQLLYLLGKRAADADSVRVGWAQDQVWKFAGKKISCPFHKLNHNLYT
jgi:hypothetical protein